MNRNSVGTRFARLIRFIQSPREEIIDIAAPQVRPDARAYLVVDGRSGRIQECTASARALLGIAGRELPVASAAELCPPDERAHFEAWLSSGAPPSPQSLHFHGRDGRAIPIEVLPIGAGDARQLVVLLAPSMHDQDARLRQLFRAVEQSPASVVITDVNGTIDYVNPKFTALTGYTADEAVGQNPRILKSGDMAPASYRDMWTTIRSGQPWHGEFHNRKKTGELYWELASISPITDEHGTITHYVAVKEDITERKVFENALRMSELKFRSIFNTSADPMLLADGLTIVDCNAATIAILRASSASEIVGRSVLAFSPPFQPDGRESASAGEAFAAKAYAEGHCRFEWQHQRLDGRAFPAEVTLTTIADGERQLLFVVWRDMTQWRAAGEALSRRAAILSTIAKAAERFLLRANWRESVDVTIAELGAAVGVSRIIVFEARFEEPANVGGQVYISRRFEWDVDPKYSRPADALQDIPMRPAHGRWVDEFLAGRVIASDLESLPEGERAVLEGQGIRSLTAVPILAGADLWGFIGFDDCEQERVWSAVELDSLRAAARLLGEAIERERAEAELKARERFIEAVARSTPDLITVFDLGRQELVYTNRPIRAALTLPTESESAPPLDTIVADDRPMVLAHMQQVAQTTDGDVLELDFRVNGTDGEPRWLRTRDTVFKRDDNGTPTQTLSIIQDITEQKRADAAREILEGDLRQAQKIEAVGQLAGGIAHDFNNLLTVILGNIEILLEDPALSDRTRARALEANEAAARAANLTQQLLAFGRKQVMRLDLLDVNEVLRRHVKMLVRVLGETVAIACDFAPGLPLVEADAGMLEQVILNLAVNARDAMPGGGSVTIATTLSIVDGEKTATNPDARPGLFVSISVADTGCGMSPDTVSRIFEPFFTTKDVGRGTGLGLSTVYGILKQHSGWIEVASEPGAGSTFTVYLPASEKPAGRSKAEPRQNPLHERGHETLLVVEDEQGVRDMTVQHLRRKGYTVLAARNGAEAIDVWREHGSSIDLLLTDVVMPNGMSGRELALKLLTRKPGLKVVYTSGYSRENLDIGGENTADPQFLSKPYALKTLSATIRRTLDGR